MDFWSIVSLGLKPLYEKNYSYYKTVKEFREKLPRQQNQARTVPKEEIEKNPFLPQSAKYFHLVDLSTHKVSINEAEIDLFYNRLNDFNYSFVFFKKHYQNFTKNINRFNPKGVKGNFDLVVLQSVLKDDPLHPLKPLDVFVYHLKWEIKFTSKIYIWFLNRNRKHPI